MHVITDSLSTMTTTEKKFINAPHEDWWVCDCGNQPDYDGFYSCKSDGVIVSPIENGDWNGNNFVCLRCGVIVNNYNLEIIGKASKQVQEKNDNYDWSNY